MQVNVDCNLQIKHKKNVNKISDLKVGNRTKKTNISISNNSRVATLIYIYTRILAQCIQIY